MKRLLQAVAVVAGAALLLLVLAVAQAWYFRPLSINVFFETAFLKQALRDPELLTQLRILEPMGIDGHNDELTDVSPAREQRRAADERRDLAWLREYDRASLDESDRVSYDVLAWYLQNRVDGEPWIYHDYPVNQMFGVQSALPTFMLSAHLISDAEGARDYVARLRGFSAKFDGLLQGLALRESRGVLPPRLTIEKVLEQMRQFVAVAPAEHVLASHLRDKLEKLDSVPQADRDRLVADGVAAVAESVIPAYQRLIAYFEALLPKATGNHGVWALPDGDKYYAWCVQNHTTLKVDADTVHATGLSEVARIEAEMNAILAARGMGQGSVGARLAKLAEDPAHLYPDSDAGRAQIIADFQRMIDEINAGIGEHFSLRPQVGVEVRRIESFREKTAPGAHYLPAPMDRSRPAVFYANLRNVAEVHRWGMRTLAYHEAVPGHHFQIAIAQEIEGVPTFRKLPLFTVYTEGWALYAEQLAKELGFVEDPLDDLGRLQAEMFRAVRLVVDTGMHHKRWTREQAIAYMLDKTGQSETDVVAEIERYLVAPGQALAYKTGMLKILELRERQRASQGERFSLRDFHTTVLGGGPMPLPVLEQQLQD